TGRSSPSCTASFERRCSISRSMTVDEPSLPLIGDLSHLRRERRSSHDSYSEGRSIACRHIQFHLASPYADQWSPHQDSPMTMEIAAPAEYSQDRPPCLWSNSHSVSNAESRHLSVPFAALLT